MHLPFETKIYLNLVSLCAFVCDVAEAVSFSFPSPFLMASFAQDDTSGIPASFLKIPSKCPSSLCSFPLNLRRYPNFIRQKLIEFF